MDSRGSSVHLLIVSLRLRVEAALVEERRD
jgi:hypothetical protein